MNQQKSLDPARGSRRREGGTVMVIAALAMATLLLFGALAIDVGFIWASRTQSQNADDAAALAAARNMINPSVPSVTIPAAEAAAIAVASQNSTVGNPNVTVTAADIEFGRWWFAGSAGSCGAQSPPCLDTTVDQNDPAQITGVRVDVQMDGVDNDRAPIFLSQFVGDTGNEVNNTAVAYLGYEGSFAEGEFELPVAIDGCDLSTGGCGEDFCATVSSPPNPCPLTEPQDTDSDAGTPDLVSVTCLEFSSTPEQNACWTAFDPDHPSVNTPGLEDIVDNGNPNDTQVGDKVYLDNGDKTPVTRQIREKFYGEGAYSGPGQKEGIDRYPPAGRSDSWVVKLPTVKCQDEDQCAGGDPVLITGGVCFEIMEVHAPPYESDRLIMGRFLCPDSSDAQIRQLWWDECYDANAPPSTSGGCNFGFRADIPVLVE